MPEAVTPPGVKAAVVSRFTYGIKDITEVDEVTTKGAFTEVNAGAANVVDGAVADGDARCHRDLDTSGLFFHCAELVDQAVIDKAVGRVVV